MTSNSISALQRVEFFFNTLNHALIGFVTIYMSWLCISQDLSTVALHAWLCTLGYHLLMAEAIMCHYQGNVLTFSYTRKTKTTIHWVFLTLGGGLAIAGNVIIIMHKSVHFNSTHGKLGLASLVLCCISMVTGLVALYSQTLRKILQPVLNKGFHTIVGIGAFVCGLVAFYYGYNTFLIVRYTTPEFQILLKVITCLVIVLSSIGPLKGLCEKVLNAFSD